MLRAPSTGLRHDRVPFFQAFFVPAGWLHGLRSACSCSSASASRLKACLVFSSAKTGSTHSRCLLVARDRAGLKLYTSRLGWESRCAMGQGTSVPVPESASGPPPLLNRKAQGFGMKVLLGFTVWGLRGL